MKLGNVCKKSMCQQQLKVEPSSTPGYTDLQTIVHSPCIARRFRRRLRDVSVTRGTDAAFEHQLITSKSETQANETHKLKQHKF